MQDPCHRLTGALVVQTHMFVLENGADGAQTHSYDTCFLGKLGRYSLEYLLVQFPVLAVSIPRTCALCAVHKAVASAVLGMLLNAMLLDSIAEVVQGSTIDHSMLRQDQAVP